jgi:plastocyanin
MKSLLRVAAVATLAAVALLAVPLVASADPKQVIMKDDCEAVSFNLAIGPGTCVGNGGTTFGDFIGQLVNHKFAGAWHFSPKQVHVSSGSSLVVTNRGGETHTFTEVTQFGSGGIVPELNEILFGTATPPTFFFGPFFFVGAGGTTTIPSSTLTTGTHRFFCAIHPWMEGTVVVEPSG